jgi:hypothetical protein
MNSRDQICDPYPGRPIGATRFVALDTGIERISVVIKDIVDYTVDYTLVIVFKLCS